MFKDDSLMQSNLDLLMEYADTPIGCLTPTLMYQILETHKHYLAIARGSNVPGVVLDNLRAQIQHTEDVIKKFEEKGKDYIEAEILIDEEIAVPAPKAKRVRKSPPTAMPAKKETA